MTSESMSSAERKFLSVPCYLLGSDRFSRSTDAGDFNSIVVALTYWIGILSDYNSMFCGDTARTSRNHGRIMKFVVDGFSGDSVDLLSLLKFLDEMNDMLIRHVAHDSGFKVQNFLTEFKTWKVASWIAPIKGVIQDILLASLLEGGEEVRLIRAARQIASFMKKLDVSRPSLEEEAEREYLEFEISLAASVAEKRNCDKYQTLTASMRRLLAVHLDGFSVTPFVPGHGPGATARKSVKCWYDKHTSACSDSRVGYLLSHANLGNQSDYLPLVKCETSDRTSRFVTVPKTWKKLRSISCEPPELQFWQQGVLRRIDWMFRHDKWWAARVNLHDQVRSRRLARKGSLTGTYSTVDLSAASDSVTLQLIRDVFGNSHLARWLIGTRSTHTMCGAQSVRLNKFAPMGSACCFPVECMIFTLAAQIAVYRTRKASSIERDVCVYGDDIIVPTYAAHELLDILDTLGFTVNTEKSFVSGEFREACGAECWRGLDIAPCRFKSCKKGLKAPYADHDEIASTVAMANEMFARGLHDTRRFLLERLFQKKIRLDKTTVTVQSTILSTFSGEAQTLSSPFPTNFNLKKKFSRLLWTSVHKRVTWREKPIVSFVGPEMSAAYDVCKYVEWLFRHQSGDPSLETMWEHGWIDIRVDSPYSRLPLGVTMVPTQKWVRPQSSNFLNF